MVCWTQRLPGRLSRLHVGVAEVAYDARHDGVAVACESPQVSRAEGPSSREGLRVGIATCPCRIHSTRRQHIIRPTRPPSAACPVICQAYTDKILPARHSMSADPAANLHVFSPPGSGRSSPVPRSSRNALEERMSGTPFYPETPRLTQHLQFYTKKTKASDDMPLVSNAPSPCGILRSRNWLTTFRSLEGY